MCQKKKHKKKSIAKLKKYVREKYFNLYIRLRDSRPDGWGYCITCNQKIYYKDGNAGHFQHGLDFIEDNQHLQCVQCNKWNSGRLDKYAIFMLDKYGRQRVEELILLKHTHPGYTRQEIEDFQEVYKLKIELLNREGKCVRNGTLLQ